MIDKETLDKVELNVPFLKNDIDHLPEAQLIPHAIDMNDMINANMGAILIEFLATIGEQISMVANDGYRELKITHPLLKGSPAILDRDVRYADAFDLLMSLLKRQGYDATIKCNSNYTEYNGEFLSENINLLIRW